MSTITHTRQDTKNSRTILVSWSPLQNGDQGDAIPFSQYADKSVQVTGIFGAGGGVTFEGSNDGVNYAPLTDAQGNDLNFSAAKIEIVCEATYLVRPRVTAGDGTTSLSVILLARE
jgi:hypothetical protein